jgi:hypothetical protein
MILKLFLWSFSTIKLQLRVLATMWVSLNISLKFNICTHNYLRVLVLSFLAWGQHSWLHSSDLYLDWIFAKITRIRELRQGNIILVHSLSFQQPKHMVSYSFDLFHVDSWTLKFPKLLSFTIGTSACFLTHILYFFRIFSKCVHTIVLIPLSSISVSSNS